MLGETFGIKIIKKLTTTLLVALLTLSFFAGLNLALAQEGDPALGAIEGAADAGAAAAAEAQADLGPAIPALPDHQTVELQEVAGQAGWTRSSLLTAGLKFMEPGSTTYI